MNGWPWYAVAAGITALLVWAWDRHRLLDIYGGGARFHRSDAATAAQAVAAGVLWPIAGAATAVWLLIDTPTRRLRLDTADLERRCADAESRLWRISPDDNVGPWRVWAPGAATRDALGVVDSLPTFIVHHVDDVAGGSTHGRLWDTVVPALEHEMGVQVMRIHRGSGGVAFAEIDADAVLPADLDTVPDDGEDVSGDVDGAVGDAAGIGEDVDGR